MSKFDKQKQRLADILETKDVPDVDTETLKRYLDYLKQYLESPCQVTGIESFEWKQYDGSEKEHKRLRQTRPSCLDKYEIINFDTDIDPEDGILVNVQRLSDKKTFVLPLAKLEVTKRKSVIVSCWMTMPSGSRRGEIKRRD